MKLRQLFVEDSDKNKFKTKRIFKTGELESFFDRHYNSIMKITESKITEYINTESLCNDKEDMFPRKSFLTGEQYVSEIYFDSMDYLSVNTTFVGTDLGYKDDYLGLEVHLYYDSKTAEFISDGIDSYAL